MALDRANELRDRKRIKELVQGCTNCSLCTVGSGPIPFRGPSPADIAIIGEAPGEVENREHKPFVGPSGKLASKWLRDAGLDPDSVAWLNVVSCFPNRTPHPKEIQSCRDTLAIQLQAIRPEWVLVMGGVATSRWWRVRLGDLRGMWWSVPESDTPGGALAMATWHPAAVLRNWHLEKQASSDVRRFVAAAVRDKIYFLREKFCVICHKEEVLRVDEKGLGWCFKHDPQSGQGGGRLPAMRKPMATKQMMGML